MTELRSVSEILRREHLLSDAIDVFARVAVHLQGRRGDHVIASGTGWAITVDDCRAAWEARHELKSPRLTGPAIRYAEGGNHSP